MNAFSWAAAVAATATILVVAVSWVIARLWCRPGRRVSSRGPADYGLRYESIELDSANVRVRGWFVSAGSPAPTVILVHGWSHTAADLLPAARALHRAGLAVVLFDARGHGASGRDGPITIPKFAQDMLGLLGPPRDHRRFPAQAAYPPLAVSPAGLLFHRALAGNPHGERHAGAQDR